MDKIGWSGLKGVCFGKRDWSGLRMIEGGFIFIKVGIIFLKFWIFLFLKIFKISLLFLKIFKFFKFKIFKIFKIYIF